LGIIGHKVPLCYTQTAFGFSLQTTHVKFFFFLIYFLVHQPSRVDSVGSNLVKSG